MKTTTTGIGLLFLLFLIFFSMLPTVAAELKGVDLKVGGDGYVRGFSTKSNNGTKNQGYAQMLRLKMDLVTEDKIKVSTRTVLSGDQWAGDSTNNTVTGNNDNGSGGNDVRLDYGFIEVPFKDGWVARAGRQTANFSDCFNTCDDRRDRLLLLKFMGKFVPALVYDKRVEGSVANQGDDADMYAAALFYLDKVHEWALLYATWFNDDDSYVLRHVHNFSPYYKYKGDKFKALAVWNWLGAGDRSSWYHGHHNSFALKGEYRFHNDFDISGQIIYSEDGGLITSGYDTYSFVVNSDPDNNRSNSRLVRLGGFGTFTGGARDDEHFIVSRLRYFAGPFTTSLAIGKAREYIAPTEFDLMVYDLQVHYQYSKSLLFKGGVALVRNDRTEEATLFEMQTSF